MIRYVGLSIAFVLLCGASFSDSTAVESAVPVLEFSMPDGGWSEAPIQVAAGRTLVIGSNVQVKIVTKNAARKGRMLIATSATANAITVDCEQLASNTVFDAMVQVEPFYGFTDDGKTLYLDFQVEGRGLIFIVR